MLIAIDPGNKESAFVYMNEISYRPKYAYKVKNEELLKEISTLKGNELVAIEMIASYGMAVGAEVFETCVWIGRFTQALVSGGIDPIRIYRKEVKSNLCNSVKAKDSNIMKALIDRFAEHDMKSGKGVKAKPDWFYGFSKDIWAAYAVGVTYLDMKRGERV